MQGLRKYVDKYDYSFSFDNRDNIYVARVAELSGIMAHGKTVEEALINIKEAVVNTLEWMEEEEQSLPEPFALFSSSGSIKLRVSPEKHRELKISAAHQGVSLNQYISNKL